MLILNEEKYAENLYHGKNNEVKSTVGKIGYITRHQLYTLNYSDQDNYKYAVEWMKQNHGNFDESTYSNLISDAIKKAHKKPFYKIDSIQITKSELEIISSLNDLRAEKVLFVLLCMAKQQSVSNGFTNGLVRYSLPDLCKMARISVPTDEREYILYNIIQSGFLSYPKKNNTQCLIINFMDDAGETEIEIDELDCQELAYTYLNWKTSGNGYDRCELCGKLIKQSKSNPKRFCRGCADVVGDISDDMKVVLCVDCGCMVYISKLNTKTCRCDECQEKYRKDYMRDLMREKRVSSASKNETIQN
jgi:hypothetical protein